jgi:hypothetical protein
MSLIDNYVLLATTSNISRQVVAIPDSPRSSRFDRYTELPEIAICEECIKTG